MILKHGNDHGRRKPRVIYQPASGADFGTFIFFIPGPFSASAAIPVVMTPAQQLAGHSRRPDNILSKLTEKGTEAHE
jgi:hypothetical protein